jgi:DNA/RNA-binding protein KIN17
MIREQIRRAKRDGMDAGVEDEEDLDTDLPASGEGIRRKDGEKVRLNFGAKKQSQAPDDDATVENPPSPPLTEGDDSSSDKEQTADSDTPATTIPTTTTAHPVAQKKENQQSTKPTLSFGLSSATSKPKNVFATTSKKNALSGPKKAPSMPAQRPMSEAERIMKEELERKRHREAGKVQGGNVFKKQRVS